jgi:hypothetical protein
MDDATYHALAAHEHRVKAGVYERHGMLQKADSHRNRAAYHASFGVTPKRTSARGVRRASTSTTERTSPRLSPATGGVRVSGANSFEELRKRGSRLKFKFLKLSEDDLITVVYDLVCHGGRRPGVVEAAKLAVDVYGEKEYDLTKLYEALDSPCGNLGEEEFPHLRGMLVEYIASGDDEVFYSERGPRGAYRY